MLQIDDGLSSTWGQTRSRAATGTRVRVLDGRHLGHGELGRRDPTQSLIPSAFQTYTINHFYLTSSLYHMHVTIHLEDLVILFFLQKQYTVFIIVLFIKIVSNNRHYISAHLT
jgi:hypothetical protein